MMKNYLGKNELVIGANYRCLARNFDVGRWDGEVFHYMRTKFGQVFPDVEYHWDDGPPYGTVKPLERVG